MELFFFFYFLFFVAELLLCSNWVWFNIKVYYCNYYDLIHVKRREGWLTEQKAQKDMLQGAFDLIWYYYFIFPGWVTLWVICRLHRMFINSLEYYDYDYYPFSYYIMKVLHDCLPPTQNNIKRRTLLLCFKCLFNINIKCIQHIPTTYWKNMYHEGGKWPTVLSIRLGGLQIVIITYRHLQYA